jgi:hypothetical protein
MPLFITYASYSHSGAKGMVDKPSKKTIQQLLATAVAQSSTATRGSIP